MANYYGTARTNYFAVKDAKAFKEEMSHYPVEVIESKDIETQQPLFGFIDANENGGGLDWYYYGDDNEGDEEELDYPAILAKHLADGWVAIIAEAGAEKYRYLNAYAIAVNSKGETREISLVRDIEKLAKELGEMSTSPSY